MPVEVLMTSALIPFQINIILIHAKGINKYWYFKAFKVMFWNSSAFLSPFSFLSALKGSFAKLIKNRGVFTNLIHLNDDIVIMLLSTPEDWRNASVIATTRKRTAKLVSCSENTPKKEKKVWSHLSTSHKQEQNLKYYLLAKLWLQELKKNPSKLRSSIHIQLVFNASFPLCYRAPGKKRARREGRLGKDSDSTSPPLLLVIGPTCHVSSQSSEAANATTRRFWWLGRRNCFPPLPTKAPSRAANISASTATRWVAGVNSPALCCYRSQVLFFKQWHTRSCS